MSAIILATLASALLTNAILFFSQRRKDRIAWAALSDKSNWAKLRRELEAAFAFCDENYGQMKQPRRPSAKTFLGTITNHDPGVQVLRGVLLTMDQLEGKIP